MKSFVLRLLLDEHISPAVAEELSHAPVEIPILALQEWEGGAYLGASDETILTSAYEQGLTLVTYDQRTIVPLLKEWGETGRPHSGVIFIDERTLRSQDVGGLVRALSQLWTEQGKRDWINKVIFLRR